MKFREFSLKLFSFIVLILSSSNAYSKYSSERNINSLQFFSASAIKTVIELNKESYDNILNGPYRSCISKNWNNQTVIDDHVSFSFFQANIPSLSRFFHKKKIKVGNKSKKLRKVLKTVCRHKKQLTKIISKKETVKEEDKIRRIRRVYLRRKLIQNQRNKTQNNNKISKNKSKKALQKFLIVSAKGLKPILKELYRFYSRLFRKISFFTKFNQTLNCIQTKLKEVDTKVYLRIKRFQKIVKRFEKEKGFEKTAKYLIRILCRFKEFKSNLKKLKEGLESPYETANKWVKIGRFVGELVRSFGRKSRKKKLKKRDKKKNK